MTQINHVYRSGRPSVRQVHRAGWRADAGGWAAPALRYTVL